MEKVYKTKIAIWLICAIIGFTVIPIIPVLVYDFSWIVVTIVALILFFALFSLFDIRYTIHNNILSVKPKSVIRDSFLLFLMTAIRKSQLYLSDCQ